MSDYSRLISYIYSYEKGIKTRNAGFARVELQGDRCKINISLRIQDILMNETEDNALEVFMFARQQGKVYKSHIGRIRISNGNSQFRAQFKDGEIGDAGLLLEEVAGIFICSRAFLTGRSTIREVYASEWDDTTIYVEEFENVSREPQTARSGLAKESQTYLAAEPQKALSEESQAEPWKESDESSKERLPQEPHGTSQERIIQEPHGTSQERIVQEPHGTSQESFIQEPHAMAAAEIVGGSREEYIQNSGGNLVADSVRGKAEHVQTADGGQQAQEAYDDLQSRTVPYDGLHREITESLTEESTQENVRKYEKELQEMLEKSDNIDENIRKPRVPENRDYFQMLCNCYPHAQVEGLGDCIKITPHDISYLPKKYWHLCNNNFLLNGYYNFRYLFLCEQDGERNENNAFQEDMARRYLICVPGFMRGREKNMARMYGFHKFIEKEQSGTEQFGYWCMEL